jgi:hypothetical protein
MEKLMKKESCFIIVVSIIFSFTLTAFSSEVLDSIVSNTKLLPKIHLYADYHGFTLQKDSLFREKYYSEHNLYVDMTFFELYKILSLNFRSEMRGGLGRSPYGLVFHPRDVSFGLIPYFQVNYKGISYQLVLDHRCFHEIDMKETPTVYWNKMILSISSENYEISTFTKNLCVERKWDLSQRFSWSCDWGYYPRSFPGVSPGKVMSDWPYYIQDFNLTGKFSFLHWRNFIVNCNGSTTIGAEYEDNSFDSKRIYWRQTAGIETLFGKPEFGGSFFVNYILDRGMQRFDSKDKLLEIGVKLFK